MKIHIRTTRCQKTELPAAVGLADGIWSRSGQAVLRGTAMAVFCMAVAVCSQAAAQEGDSATNNVIESRAAVLSEQNWDELAPSGKEVDAIYGDFVLKNDLITAVIAQPLETRNANMTVKKVAGGLLDLTVNAHQSDQLSAFYPGRRLFPFQGGHTLSSATSTQLVDGFSATSSVATVTVESPGDGRQPSMIVSYSVENGKSFVAIQSVWVNTTEKDITLALEDDLRADAGKEDMPKAANGTADLFWFHDIYWQQAYGVAAPGFKIRSNSNSRESVLAYEPEDGKPVVLKPGDEFSLTRHVYVAKDLPSMMALHDIESGRADSLADVTLRVTDSAGQPVASARVALQVNGQSRGTAVTDADGMVQVALPHSEPTAEAAIEATAEVTVAGQTFAATKFQVQPGSATVQIGLAEYSPGVASITVTDAEGHAIPAKIEFDGNGNTPTPDWGPETAEHFVRNLAYTPDGKVQTVLSAGEYDLIISRGPEYDAEFTRLKIEPGKTTQLTARLARVVQTPGWVSADFHSHSSPSGDNTSSQLGRVLNLAAEHVEFAPCTEHNRVSSYDNHIAVLGLKDFLATISGIELTGSPLPLNHQNSFPLIHKPRTQDGGGPTPDGSPETQMERLAAWDNNSEKLIQQNHPDLGWLFFDKNGDQQPDEGYSRSFPHMNVMEIHPIDPILDLSPVDARDGKPFGNSRLFNWLQLLNQGFRIYGVVNTDSHYNFHGSGGLRLWLKSSTDNPADIDSEEMKTVSRAGHIIMSNGPYLETTVSESGNPDITAVAGQDLSAASGKVTAKIRVQCPNWFDIDTVFVLINGRKRDDLTFSRDTHPDMFAAGTVKFDQSVDITLDGDAHIVVVTGHRTELLGDVQGPQWGTQHPAALTNPIFVDVDANGFEASKDTLDHPLPVKFVARP